MKKTLFSLAASMVLSTSLVVPVLAYEEPIDTYSTQYLQEQAVVKEILSEKGVELTKEEILEDENAKKVYDTFKSKMEQAGLIVTGIKIFKINQEKVRSQSLALGTTSSCSYSGSYAYRATTEGYAPYDNGALKQHTKVDWQVFNPPSGKVGLFYKAASANVWWTRTSTAYNVRNASVILDVQAMSWCGNVKSGTYTKASNLNPTWSGNTSEHFYPNISINDTDFPPVTTSSLNYIQVVTKGDVYKNGTLVKSGLSTQVNP